MVNKHIVYIGQRLGSDGKPMEVFHAIDDDGKLGDPVGFKKSKNISGYRVGHVYEIESDGSTYRFHTTKWMREYGDKEQVRQWQADYQASRAAAAAKVIERQEATNDSALLRSIEELRTAYHQLPIPQRLGFEVWVLSKIRRAK